MHINLGKNDEDPNLNMVTINVCYVHKKNGTKKINMELDKLSYDNFLAECLIEFNIHEINVDDILLKGYNRNQPYTYVEITETTFIQTIKDNCIDRSGFVINIGKNPDVPQITQITRIYDIIKFTTKTLSTDTAQYEHCYQLKDVETQEITIGTVIKGDNGQYLQISGLSPQKQYSVRINVLNGIGKSDFCRWKYIDINKDMNEIKTFTKAPQDAVMQPKISAKPRYIWYLTKDNPPKGSYFQACMLYHTQNNDVQEKRIQFITVSDSVYFVHFPECKYYRRWNTYTSKWDKCLAIRIYEIDKKGNVRDSDHVTITGRHKCNFKYDSVGFCLPPLKKIHIIDASFNTFGTYFAAQDTARHKYYSHVSSTIVSYLLKMTNDTICPYASMLTIEKLWSFITRDCQYHSSSEVVKLLRRQITNVCKFKNMNELKNINTWANASMTLACLGAIMKTRSTLAHNSYNLEIDNTSLQCIFAQITDPNVFGKINDILSNIGNIYTKRDISQLRDNCWKSQTRKYDEGQCLYLLWYNLLCCIEADPLRNIRRKPIIHHTQIQQKTINDIVALDNRLQNQPHPLANLRWDIIMKSDTTLRRECLALIEEISDVNEMLQFIKTYEAEIRVKMINDPDGWLRFMKIIFSKLKLSPCKELHQISFRLFLSKIEFMANSNNQSKLLGFCRKNAPFMKGSGIEEHLIEYPSFVEDEDFIPLFVSMLSPKVKKNKDFRKTVWWYHLNKCTEIWFKRYGLQKTIEILRDNKLDVSVITELFTNNDKFNIGQEIQDFNSKLDAILDSQTYDLSLRNLIINSIHQSFEDLKPDQVKHLINICEQLMQKETDVCDILLRKLIKTFNPFATSQSYTDTDIIQYMTSERGCSFVNLLTSLHKHKQFTDLSIHILLKSFESWWFDKVERIAEGTETCAVVAQLSGSVPFNTINNLYNKAGLKRIQVKYVSACTQHIQNPNLYSLSIQQVCMPKLHYLLMQE